MSDFVQNSSFYYINTPRVAQGRLSSCPPNPMISIRVDGPTVVLDPTPASGLASGVRMVGVPLCECVKGALSPRAKQPFQPSHGRWRAERDRALV
eukprot:231236-Prymnesium_polylepis.1